MEITISLKNKLRKEKSQDWYFVVRYLVATGAQVINPTSI